MRVLILGGGAYGYARGIRNWLPHPLEGSCPPHQLKTALSALNNLVPEIK